MRQVLLLLSLVGWGLSGVQAEVLFPVAIVDPGGEFTPLHSAIRHHIETAGADWAQYLSPPSGTNPSIEVQVEFAAIATANGASETSSFVASRNGFNVYEQGMAAEIRTGVDPNGGAPDVVLRFGRDFVRDELWFDPDPERREDPVPKDKTDAYSTILHELGHALAFSGWRDYVTGALPLPAGATGAYQSTWDESIVVEAGGEFSFLGAVAQARYGAPVPLTSGNIPHLGNSPPGAGSDLLPDLMNGVVAYRGERYFISTINLAVLQDLGLPLGRTTIVSPEIRSLESTAEGTLTVQWTGANYRLRLEQSPSLTGDNWSTVLAGLQGTKATFPRPLGDTHFFRLIAD